eukprot:2560159-Prymnesium_polylepis.1
MEDWSKCPKENVLLYDPTFGTNKHNLKLWPFVTVAPTGRTTIMANLLVFYENRRCFEWGFRCFAAVFGTSSAILVTDDDQEIEEAVDIVQEQGNVWHGVVHNRC